MPIDTKRICGPEQSTPYQVYCTPSECHDENKEKEYKVEQMFVNTGVVSQAKGSAYLEIGKIKVIASVYGPREVMKKQDFSINGQLSCEVKYAPYSCANVRRNPQGSNEEAELSSVLCDSLKPAICMQKFPKSRVDIFVIILENGDGAIGGMLTCASLALVDAGIEMYDVVIGSSLHGGPCFTIEDDNSSISCPKIGSVTLALLPSLDQITCIRHVGEISTERLSEAVKILMEQCRQIYPLVQKYLLSNLKKEIKPQT